MKPEEMFQQLKELSEKLDISVSEENLRDSKARSGFCVVRNRNLFILDKHKSIHEKNAILAAFLSGRIGDDIFVVPAVREFIIENADDREGT